MAFGALTGLTLAVQRLAQHDKPEDRPVPVTSAQAVTARRVHSAVGAQTQLGNYTYINVGSLDGGVSTDASADASDATFENERDAVALATPKAFASLEAIEELIRQTFGPDVGFYRDFNCDEGCARAFIQGEAGQYISFYVELDGTFTLVPITIRGVEYPEKNIVTLSEMISFLDERLAACKTK